MFKYLKKTLILIILFSLIISVFILPVMAANPTTDTLKSVGEKSGYQAGDAESANKTFTDLAGQVVKAFLSWLGIVFLVLMLYGGYNWMISAGDESKVDKAKETIKNAIIGIIITAGAYGIWAFVAKFIL